MDFGLSVFFYEDKNNFDTFFIGLYCLFFLGFLTFYYSIIIFVRPFCVHDKYKMANNRVYSVVPDAWTIFALLCIFNKANTLRSRAVVKTIRPND